MNKKYLAVVMAGATVATSVAPVFAVEENSVTKETITVKEADSLIKEVDNLLKIKYNVEGEIVTSVYEIKAGSEIITKSEDLKKKIEEIPNNGQLVVTIKDKGHAKDADGNIVSEAVGTYKTYADLSSEAQNIATANEATDDNRKGLYSIANVSAELKKSTTDEDILSITLESKKNKTKKKTININLGDNKVNLNAKPLDKDGKEIELDADIELSEIESLAEAGPEVIPAKEIKEVTIKNGELAVVDASDIYDGYRLSSKGVEIVKDADRVVGGVSEKDEETGKYSYVVKYVDAAGNPIELTVESTNKTTLENSRKAIALDTNNVKVNVLAGANRYSTAIEIAKESGLNNNIVIVNSSKLVDGLAATPFAKSKSAPILLASDTEVPQVTLDYIKSVIKSKPSANIYIVGGESSVSKAAEEQLTNITSNVERIAGDDRHTTSLEVAKALDSSSDKAYVVGATGEADAMSIAAKAAEENSPIVVSGWSGLSNESKTMLKDKEIDIIGGFNSVSSSIENDLKLVAKDSEVARVQGATRHDTNAKVIEKYYADSKTLYVAKDGYGNNNMLIDALAAGPLAAGNGPILLATDQMTDSQENAVTEKISKDAEVIQIGNGIKTAVYTKLSKILGW